MSAIAKKLDTDIPKNSRMYATDTSGQVIPLSVDLSGQISVSLETADTLIAKVSGETLISKVSGETVIITSGTTVLSKISGETIIVTSGTTILSKVSGETIIVTSGTTILSKVSGETIISKVSGEIVIGKVSGETVTVASGLNVIPQSGVYVVWASGAAVTTGVSLSLQSGSVVMPEAFSITSGFISVQSGQLIAKISGDTVSVSSGVEIVWRGVTVSGSVIVSGTVKISGETIVSASGVEIIWRGVTVSGSVAVSGVVSVSGNVISSASGVELLWRGVQISGAVIVSGNVGVSSGIEIIWRPANISGAIILSKNSGQSVVIGSPIDVVDSSVITIDLVHHKVHEGDYHDAYVFQTSVNTVSGLVLHIVTPSSKAIHWLAFVESDVAGAVELWEDVTVAASGTVVVTRNRNRDSLTSGTVLAFSQPGYTSGGGVLLQKRFLGTNNNRTELGGTLRDNAERILRSGVGYIVKFIPENVDNNVVIEAEWYEV